MNLLTVLHFHMLVSVYCERLKREKFFLPEPVKGESNLNVLYINDYTLYMKVVFGIFCCIEVLKVPTQNTKIKVK